MRTVKSAVQIGWKYCRLQLWIEMSKLEENKLMETLSWEKKNDFLLDFDGYFYLRQKLILPK